MCILLLSEFWLFAVSFYRWTGLLAIDNILNSVSDSDCCMTR